MKEKEEADEKRGGDADKNRRKNRIGTNGYAGDAPSFFGGNEPDPPGAPDRLRDSNAEDGKLVGILSIDDIALKAEGGLRADLSAQDLENTLRAICAHRTLPLAKLLA
jgi:hypothetical protein